MLEQRLSTSTYIRVVNTGVLDPSSCATQSNARRVPTRNASGQMTQDREARWAEFFNGHAPAYDENCFTKATLAEVDFLEEELDLKMGMLVEARRKAAREGVDVTWIESDAQDLSLPEQFDAAICLCEGSFGLLGSTDDPIRQPRAILGNIAGALKVGAPCLLTVLNAYALSRKHTQASIEQGLFDPLALTECSECQAPRAGEGKHLRERAFVPTELVLLFGLAGLEVTHIWGGTAGNWGRRPIDLDEMEIMVVGHRAADGVHVPYSLSARQ